MSLLLAAILMWIGHNLPVQPRTEHRMSSDPRSVPHPRCFGVDHVVGPRFDGKHNLCELAVLHREQPDGLSDSV